VRTSSAQGAKELAGLCHPMTVAHVSAGQDTSLTERISRCEAD
jgi:hypothetical protein